MLIFFSSFSGGGETSPFFTVYSLISSWQRVFPSGCMSLFTLCIPICMHEIGSLMHVLLLLKIKDSSNAFFHASVCVRALFLQLGVSLKWSYLSQHSSPMTGGMEGNRDGVLRGTRGSQAGAIQQHG